MLKVLKTIKKYRRGLHLFFQQIVENLLKTMLKTQNQHFPKIAILNFVNSYTAQTYHYNSHYHLYTSTNLPDPLDRFYTLKITSQKICSIISTTRSHIHYQSVIMNTPLYSVYIYKPALLRCSDRICFFILLSHNYHTKFSSLKLSQIYHNKCCTKISSSVIQALSLLILSVTFSHNYHITNIYQTHWHLQFSNQMTQYVSQNYKSNLLRPDRLSTFLLEKMYNTPQYPLEKTWETVLQFPQKMWKTTLKFPLILWRDIWPWVLLPRRTLTVGLWFQPKPTPYLVLVWLLYYTWEDVVRADGVLVDGRLSAAHISSYFSLLIFFQTLYNKHKTLLVIN